MRTLCPHFWAKMFDVGDLPVLTFGNCALKTEVVKWPLKLYVRFFSKSKKAWLFTFFELLHAISPRFVPLPVPPCREAAPLNPGIEGLDLWGSVVSFPCWPARSPVAERFFCIYIYILPNHGSSSMNYSKQNIQQNKQTKKKKKLTTLSRRISKFRPTLKFRYTFSPQIAWHVKWKTLLTIFDKINITCFK